jgi:hypothetical protein
MPGSSPFDAPFEAQGEQGKPALRKAPGPLTNKQRERALGYKIGHTTQKGWGTRSPKEKSIGEILRGEKRPSG